MTDIDRVQILNAMAASYMDRALAAEARLAAVEALCDNPHAYVAGERIPVVHVSAVRHALRGEGDRPAEVCSERLPAGPCPYPVVKDGCCSFHQRVEFDSGEGDRG